MMNKYKHHTQDVTKEMDNDHNNMQTKSSSIPNKRIMDIDIQSSSSTSAVQRMDVLRMSSMDHSDAEEMAIHSHDLSGFDLSYGTNEIDLSYGTKEFSDA
jgi:hypothetical protein